jgi:hypothetical protein
MHLRLLFCLRHRSGCRRRSNRSSGSSVDSLAVLRRNFCLGFPGRNISGLCQRGDEVISCALEAAYFRINLSDYFYPCRHAESFYRPPSSYADALPCGNSPGTLLFAPDRGHGLNPCRPQRRQKRSRAGNHDQRPHRPGQNPGITRRGSIQKAGQGPGCEKCGAQTRSAPRAAIWAFSQKTIAITLVRRAPSAIRIPISLVRLDVV